MTAILIFSESSKRSSMTAIAPKISALILRDDRLLKRNARSMCSASAAFTARTPRRKISPKQYFSRTYPFLVTGSENRNGFPLSNSS